jgi:exopolyphosphatase/guanosine-5'-triphosphate,3'-diphosphate pyrophosphatase
MSARDQPAFAAIDVGTNAVRLKVARGRGVTLDALHQRRDPVRPGEGVFTTGMLPEPVADRLIEVLREYADLAAFYRAKVRAVATSALRDAGNRDEVLARIRSEANVELEVISGREEARLVCLGVLAGAMPHRRSICIDLGGGSTEVALALGELPTGLFSLSTGAVRLTDQAGGDGPISRAKLETMRELAREAVRDLPRELKDHPTEGLGCSGTVRAVVSFATAEARPQATLAELSRTVQDLAALNPEVRRGLFEARRADIIVAGAVILEAVARQLGLQTVRAVKRGLRDGILHDLVRAAQPAAAPLARARTAGA